MPRRVKVSCMCDKHKAECCDLIRHGSCIKCCVCSDKRSDAELRTVYIDGVGEVNLRKLKMKVPRDMFYCPQCRKTRTSSAEFYDKVRNRVQEQRLDDSIFD